ncbi:hypothetical protein L2E82_32208 [Cichorium intybus]|uniref:Uncharacterized protein n=1 Tax=Cichorium intybus TaxID=13427 RepID=A0ACB9BFN8_CICIN|nr:hypothetical protein L2E82_32208 [Cichorium intybus]
MSSEVSPDRKVARRRRRGGFEGTFEFILLIIMLASVVRYVRKSVANELVSLQEKVDSLTFVKSETLSEETTSSIDYHEVEATNSQDGDGEENCSNGRQPQVESQN